MTAANGYRDLEGIWHRQFAVAHQPAGGPKGGQFMPSKGGSAGGSGGSDGGGTSGGGSGGKGKAEVPVPTDKATIKRMQTHGAKLAKELTIGPGRKAGIVDIHHNGKKIGELRERKDGKPGVDVYHAGTKTTLHAGGKNINDGIKTLAGLHTGSGWMLPSGKTSDRYKK